MSGGGGKLYRIFTIFTTFTSRNPGVHVGLHFVVTVCFLIPAGVWLLAFIPLLICMWVVNCNAGTVTSVEDFSTGRRLPGRGRGRGMNVQCGHRRIF